MNLLHYFHEYSFRQWISTLNMTLNFEWFLIQVHELHAKQ